MTDLDLPAPLAGDPGATRQLCALQASRRTIALVLAFSLLCPAATVVAGPRTGSRQDAAGSIAGIATTSAGIPVPAITLRLRDLSTGYVVATTLSALNGGFGFGALRGRSYVIEVVCPAGEVVAASGAVRVAPGSAVRGVSVVVPASLCESAGTKTAATTGNPASVDSNSALLILTVAAAAGVTAAISTGKNGKASPSK